VWETHVVAQVVRHYFNMGVRPPLWFWRTEAGDEVDLLIERGARFVAIEAKLTENPTHRAAKGIDKLESFYGASSVERGYIACRTAHNFPLADDGRVMAVSVSGLLAQLGGSRSGGEKETC
jgi:predicted AAA+ superfamily ATPase